MAELIEFPDVENLVRLHLTANLGGPVAYVGSKPSTLPGEFVFIRRTGGPRRDLVTDNAQVTVESYAKSGSRAVAIAGKSRALLHRAAEDGALSGATVYEVNEFSGPYLDPDPNAPTHVRYSATYQVAVRGTAA